MGLLQRSHSGTCFVIVAVGDRAVRGITESAKKVENHLGILDESLGLILFRVKYREGKVLAIGGFRNTTLADTFRVGWGKT